MQKKIVDTGNNITNQVHLNYIQVHLKKDKMKFNI